MDTWWVNLLFLAAGSLVSFIPQEISRINAEKREFKRSLWLREATKIEMIADGMAAIYASIGTDDFEQDYSKIIGQITANRAVLFKHPALETMYQKFAEEVLPIHVKVCEVWEGREQEHSISYAEIISTSRKQRYEIVEPIRNLVMAFAQKAEEITVKRK